MGFPSIVKQTARGYHRASPPMRGGFGIIVACAPTILIARAVSNLEERRRPASRMRSLGRRAYHAPGGEELRIHHFVPGVLVAVLVGGLAILNRDDDRERWLGPAFGVGLGLTLDETALLVRLDNPYWGYQTLALAEASTAALGALALAVRFQRRGGGHECGPAPECGHWPSC